MNTQSNHTMPSSSISSFNPLYCCQSGDGPTHCPHCRPYQNAEKRDLEHSETTKTASKLLMQILARAAPRIDRVIDDELNKMWNECHSSDGECCESEGDLGHSSPLRDSKL